jgi:hypothetical protein
MSNLTVPGKPNDGRIPYYEGYDKEAERNRGVILFSVFAVLFLITLFLWIWRHIPGMFLGDGTWRAPCKLLV